MISKYLTLGLVVVIIAVVLMANINCATVFDGTKPSGQRGDIMWGYFVLDVVCWGFIGLIIDFADGAIYAKVPASTDIEKDMKIRLAKHMPVYRVTDNKIYSVTLSNNDTLCYTPIARELLPPRVVETIEKQMK
jgi:hypothetical protein